MAPPEKPDQGKIETAKQNAQAAKDSHDRQDTITPATSEAETKRPVYGSKDLKANVGPAYSVLGDMASDLRTTRQHTDNEAKSVGKVQEQVMERFIQNHPNAAKTEREILTRQGSAEAKEQIAIINHAEAAAHKATQAAIKAIGKELKSSGVHDTPVGVGAATHGNTQPEKTPAQQRQ